MSTKKPVKLDVEPGDLVELTPEAVRDVPDLTPVKLFSIGWPNRFLVFDVYEHPEKGQLISLDPCCAWMVNLSTPDGQHLCQAHPARFFKKVEGEKVDLGDKPFARYAGVEIDGQEFVSVRGNGGRETAFTVRLPGNRLVTMTGTVVKELYDRVAGKK